MMTVNSCWLDDYMIVPLEEQFFELDHRGNIF